MVVYRLVAPSTACCNYCAVAAWGYVTTGLGCSCSCSLLAVSRLLLVYFVCMVPWTKVSDMAFEITAANLHLALLGVAVLQFWASRYKDGATQDMRRHWHITVIQSQEQQRLHDIWLTTAALE